MKLHNYSLIIVLFSLLYISCSEDNFTYQAPININGFTDFTLDNNYPTTTNGANLKIGSPDYTNI